MKLKAGKLAFNVSDTGAGEPALVFLHYWGRSARTWSAVGPASAIRSFVQTLG
jgi:hypothetical protein